MRKKYANHSLTQESINATTKVRKLFDTLETDLAVIAQMDPRYAALVATHLEIACGFAVKGIIHANPDNEPIN